MNKKEILEEINKNKDWYNKSYSGYYIGIHEQGLGFNHESIINNQFMLKIFLFFQNYDNKDHFDTFWNYNEMRNKRQEIIEKVTTDKKFLSAIYEEWQPLYKHFVNACNAVSSLDLPKLSNKELKNNFFNLHKALLDSCRWAYVVDILLSNEAEDWLTMEIKKELGDKATAETIEILTYPMHASFVEEAHLAILKVAKFFKEGNDSEARMQAEIFVKNYFWFRTNYKSYKDFQ